MSYNDLQYGLPYKTGGGEYWPNNVWCFITTTPLPLIGDTMIDFIASIIIMSAIIHFDEEQKTKYPMDEIVIDPNHYKDKN